MSKPDPLSFLASIAAYYASRPGGVDWSSLTFVTPNKRSAMFLKKMIRERMSGVTFMPGFITMERLVSNFAQLPQAPRKELLFILYTSYRNVMKGRGATDSLRDFDSFIFWGDMILNDFDDIDRSLADASQLFKNLRDIRELQSDFLDDSQKEIVRRLWGDSRLTAAGEDFWLHFHPGIEADGKGDIKSRFIYLWEILGELYSVFHRELAARGIASSGCQHRSAAAILGKIVPDELPDDSKHFAFIGFDKLYPSELLIMNRLRDIGAADFFWDCGAPMLTSATGDNDSRDGNDGNRMLRRLSALTRKLPAPSDYDYPAPDNGNPDIEVKAVPSKIEQAKQLHDILSRWVADGTIDPANPIDTAVVLPDESLLLPVLYSIPEEIKTINITMGLPYARTTFASLFRAVVSMQKRARKIHGIVHFYYEDVDEILSHPHIRLIAPDECEQLKKHIADKHIYNIAADDIKKSFPLLAPVFTPVIDSRSADEVGSYMLKLIDWLHDSINAASSNPVRTTGSFEIRMLERFRNEAQSIRTLAMRHEVIMSENTFFVLFERLFSIAQIFVKGKPLQGLQIMGVLETRALDFNNVIILSMNERVFPRRQYSRTMIPNRLRVGYGLPGADIQEGVFAYCFYRLLGRARRVRLMYDSRTTSFGAGEASRYLLQLRYLMPQYRTRFTTGELPAIISDPHEISIGKNAPDVRRRLDRMRPGGNLRLSASALKTYKKCPLQFYLTYVCSMRPDEELPGFVTSADYGSVVHKVIELLYKPYRNCLITGDTIDSWLNDSGGIIGRHVREQMYLKCYPGYIRDGHTHELPTEGKVACDISENMIRTMLACERDAAGRDGFTFIDAEKEVNKVWHIAPGLDVNFKMSVDRVDRLDAATLRFIDFKTGGDEIAVPDITDLFVRGEERYDAIFQVLTYCEAYSAIEDSEVDIVPLIYPLRKLKANGGILPIKAGKEELRSFRSVSPVFLPLLKDMISEIFDPDVPFSQAEKPESCTFCPFISLCGRSAPTAF